MGKLTEIEKSSQKDLECLSSLDINIEKPPKKDTNIIDEIIDVVDGNVDYVNVVNDNSNTNKVMRELSENTSTSEMPIKYTDNEAKRNKAEISTNVADTSLPDSMTTNQSNELDILKDKTTQSKAGEKREKGDAVI